jgi:hypothetical protein
MPKTLTSNTNHICDFIVCNEHSDKRLFEKKLDEISKQGYLAYKDSEFPPDNNSISKIPSSFRNINNIK